MLRLYFIIGLIALTPMLNAQSKIRLIGFESGYEDIHYRTNDRQYYSQNILGVLPDGFTLPTNTGDYQSIGLPINREITIGPEYLRETKSHNPAWQVNINSIFQFKKKDGSYSKNHLLKAGLSYEERRLFCGQFNLPIMLTDTFGTAEINGQPYDVYITQMHDEISQTSVNAKFVKLALSYQYKIYPVEHFSLLLGAGADAGMLVSGSFGGNIVDAEYTRYYANEVPIELGRNYTKFNKEYFGRKFSGGSTISAFSQATINWHVSNKQNFLKHFNVFVSGRWGYNWVKLPQSQNYGSRFLSASFGISYIFDKYYKS